jgi:hypothetical protein
MINQAPEDNINPRGSSVEVFHMPLIFSEKSDRLSKRFNL